MLARRCAVTAILVVANWMAASLALSAGTHSQRRGNLQDARAAHATWSSRPRRVALGPQGPPDPAALRARAVPPERLKMFTPEAILKALTSGKMQTQAAALTDAERRTVSEFAAGQTFSAAAAALANSLCKDTKPVADVSKGNTWASWGNGVDNARFQPKDKGKVTAADLPRMKLKWAFGYANIASARAQPIVAGGRLFAASENREVHALNPKTGCTYWTYKADYGVRAALSVGPYKANGKSGTAVYFGDTRANAYAVDANTGKEIWKTKVDNHAFAGITGAPVVYGGKMFVPVQGISEEGTGAFNNYACCTFRGNVTALDSNSGKILWKTYTVGESKPRGKNKEGKQTYSAPLAVASGRRPPSMRSASSSMSPRATATRTRRSP